MMDRRKMALKALKVASWPYTIPPLRWVESFVEWCAATNRRFWITITLSAAAVVLAVVVALR